MNDLRASLASLQTLDDPSQIAQARRMVAAVAQACGFDEVGSGRASLVATELATNVLKHAGRGFLICQRLIHRGGVGVEILALDQGPGIGDVEGCFRDGYSTAGTAGTGLGAIRRLSHEVDLYAQPGAGTAVLARLWLHPPASGTRHFAMATLILPVDGETVCGDAVSSSGHWPRQRLVLVDGLGHGRAADEAARATLDAIAASPESDVSTALRGAHGAIRHTRGAAAAVCQIDAEAHTIALAGVGNVAAQVLAGEGTSRALLSHNGTLGYQALRFHATEVPWQPGSQLIMHSDGIATRWDLQRYPGLRQRDPLLIAGVIWRDFRRTRDDASIAIIRER